MHLLSCQWRRLSNARTGKPTGLIDDKSKLAEQGFSCFYLPGYGIEFRDSAKQLVARFDAHQSSHPDKVLSKNSTFSVKSSAAPKTTAIKVNKGISPK